MELKINRIISFSILSIWGFLLIFGIITLLSPDWLSELSNPGKNVEAITLKNAGDNYLKSKRYNLAIAQYTAAIEIVPELKSAIANLAVAYQKTGDFNKAIISFNHLLTLNPEYPGMIYYNLGDIHEKTGQTKKAIKSYLQAADTSAFPEKSHQKAGQLFMERKDWDKAILNFKLAVDNRKTMENEYKGMLLTNQKAYADTSDTYIEIAKLIDSKSYQNILSQYDEGIFNNQLNRDIALAKTCNNIGYCLAMQKKYEESLTYLNMAIKINPSYTEAKNNLKVVESFLNECMSRKETAKEKLRKETAKN